MSSGCKAWLALLLVGSVQAAPLELPNAPDQPVLKAHWFPLDAAGRHPTVLALHGCGGLYQKDGKTLDARYPSYVAEFKALGLQVLLPDSWGSRGLGAQCAVRYEERQASVADRRADALAALNWLRQQPSVDPERIVLLGWSNGATTSLTVIDRRREPAPPPLAAALLYYPGCAKQQKVPAPAMPVLMQLGAADDWTPAAPCEKLAARWSQAGAEVQRISYPGAYHGFDSERPVRFRPEVPNGVDAKGVHQGGDPAARLASFEAMRAFVRRVLLREPAS